MFRLVRNLWGWWRDYVYVVFWQIRGLIFRSNPRRYLRVTGPARAPIVLIPGVYESWQFMKPVADMLWRAGHPVHVLASLGYNTGKIPDMSELVREYITHRGLSGVIIVAHSKGGLIAKLALSEYGPEGPIRHVIAINTPFSGSKYAYLFLLPSVRTFTPTHRLIRFLAKNQEINSHITSMYAQFDPHIPEKSALPGAENIELPLVGHFRPIGNRGTLARIAELVARYDGDIATQPTEEHAKGRR